MSDDFDDDGELNFDDDDGELTIGDDSSCDFSFEPTDDVIVNNYGRIEEYVNTAGFFLPSFSFLYRGNGVVEITAPTSVLPLSLRKANFDHIENLVTLNITLQPGDDPLRVKPVTILYECDGNKNFLGKTLVQEHVNDFFDPDYNPSKRKLRSISLILDNSISVSELGPDPKYVQELISMGFSRSLAQSALLQTNNNLQSAVDLLLSGKVKKRPNNTNNKDQSTSLSYDQSPLVYLSIEIIDGFLDLVDHCCICGKQLEVSGVKPMVCDSKLCYFSFVEIGVGANIVQEIRRDPIAADLVISLASVAAGTKFMVPHPDAPDGVLRNFFDILPSTGDLSRYESDRQLISSIGKEFYDILRFIMLANRSHLITLKGEHRLPEAAFADYQFLITSAPPEREAALNNLKKKYGQIWLWHGSPGDRWYSIFHNGLKDYGSTDWQTNDGHWEGILGVYESDEFNYSYCYSQRGSVNNKYRRSKLSKQFHIVALVENANMPNLKYVMQNEYAQRDETALIPRVLMLINKVGGYTWNTVKNPPKHVPTLQEIIGEKQVQTQQQQKKKKK
ncbi:UBA/TS-N domain containing protein [Histomonas meleagridis]|uniref:UBA/TS-N domain containing protein n=1 Tax=Histomonas meleagridis TaxID=135588 RepID=UPI003559C5BF|nr:UBA/TS-N domain containing protein [Histomonas meleagridis]KAH0802367.1 UBA/TS-N domain containing protein [Histomonas meleagridis]